MPRLTLELENLAAPGTLGQYLENPNIQVMTAVQTTQRGKGNQTFQMDLGEMYRNIMDFVGKGLAKNDHTTIWQDESAPGFGDYGEAPYVTTYNSPIYYLPATQYGTIFTNTGCSVHAVHDFRLSFDPITNIDSMSSSIVKFNKYVFVSSTMFGKEVETMNVYEKTTSDRTVDQNRATKRKTVKTNGNTGAIAAIDLDSIDATEYLHVENTKIFSCMLQAGAYVLCYGATMGNKQFVFHNSVCAANLETPYFNTLRYDILKYNTGSTSASEASWGEYADVERIYNVGNVNEGISRPEEVPKWSYYTERCLQISNSAIRQHRRLQSPLIRNDNSNQFMISACSIYGNNENFCRMLHCFHDEYAILSFYNTDDAGLPYYRKVKGFRYGCRYGSAAGGTFLEAKDTYYLNEKMYSYENMHRVICGNNSRTQARLAHHINDLTICLAIDTHLYNEILPVLTSAGTEDKSWSTAAGGIYIRSVGNKNFSCCSGGFVKVYTGGCNKYNYSHMKLQNGAAYFETPNGFYINGINWLNNNTSIIESGQILDPINVTQTVDSATGTIVNTANVDLIKDMNSQSRNLSVNLNTESVTFRILAATSVVGLQLNGTSAAVNSLPVYITNVRNAIGRSEPHPVIIPSESDSFSIINNLTHTSAALLFPPDSTSGSSPIGNNPIILNPGATQLINNVNIPVGYPGGAPINWA